MFIYNILSSIPHNPHYLNRYFKFIKGCQKVNENFDGYTEKHHICPRSLFPEYKSFGKHSWNKAVLTARQHFIAHWILWKSYPDSKYMIRAFWLMSHSREVAKVDSRTYSKLSEEYSEKVRNTAKKRVENGTHNFLNGEITRKRIKDGTYHFLGPENNKKRVENGTHNFLGGEIQRKAHRKRVEDGTHHCIGMVPCYDKRGNFNRVSREFYLDQTGPKINWEYIHVSSKEGKKRKFINL